MPRATPKEVRTGSENSLQVSAWAETRLLSLGREGWSSDPTAAAQAGRDQAMLYGRWQLGWVAQKLRRSCDGG